MFKSFNSKKHLFFVTIVIAALTAFLCVSASAKSTTVESGSWVYSIENGVASIAGYKGYSSDVTLPTTATLNGSTYNIRTVGEKAFKNNTTIRSVTIPEEYITLSKGAFSGCTNLKSLTINGNLGQCYDAYIHTDAVFYNTGTNTDGITVTFGPSVKKVPANLFRTREAGNGDCYAHVKTVILSSSIEEIGASAFRGCPDLTTIDFEKATSLKEIKESAFQVDVGITSIKFPKTFATIGNYAFSGCSGLESIVLPEKTASVGKGAFANCTNLKNLSINGNLGQCYDAYIHTDAVFYNTGTNTDGITVTFGPSVKKVPANLFRTREAGNGDYYAHVKTVILSSSIEEIGVSAFRGCPDLTTIDFEKATSLKEIKESAFQVDIGITSIKFPKSFATIGNYAFSGCSGLESIVLPEKTASVGKGAFTNCTNLKNLSINGNLGQCYDAYIHTDAVFYNTGTNSDGITVTFGPSVKKIPANLFRTREAASTDHYAHVRSVMIDVGIAEIGNYSFAGCYDLNRVDIKSRNLTAIGTHSFNDCPNLQVRCYSSANTATTLQNAGIKYSVFADDISISAPSTPKASAIKTNALRLTWTGVSGAKGYTVYQYNPSSDSYKKIGTTAKTVFIVKNLKAGTTYRFAVKAYKTVSGTNYYSNYSKLMTTVTKPISPTIKVTAGTRQATVKWKAVKGATSYIVYRGTSEDGSYKKVGTTEKTSFKAKKLVSDEYYYFKVVAVAKVSSTTVKSAASKPVGSWIG